MSFLLNVLAVLSAVFAILFVVLLQDATHAALALILSGLLITMNDIQEIKKSLQKNIPKGEIK